MSWRLPLGEVGGMVVGLLPADGFVAAGGQEAMALLDRGDLRLEDVPGRWSWGRAFSPEREVLWRCEGGEAAVVLVGGAPAALPAGWRELPGADAWQEVPAGDRRPQLLLWRRDDLRLPREPELPRSLSGRPDLVIEVREYHDGESVVWTRYLRVAPGEDGDGNARR